MQKWLNSTRHALHGIIFLFQKERNTKIEFVIAIMVLLLGWWLQISVQEWCLISLCIAGVLTAEAINTSIEQLSDFQTREIDPRIRVVKDVAAGGVLIMAIASVIVGFLVFGPKLWYKI
jgi:diacylglycerol kinase